MAHYWSKQKLSAYLKQRYAEQMSAFREFLGGRCCQCGSVEALVIDHVDPKNKSFNIAKHRGNGNLEAVFEELKKCQLLCGACNLEKTRKDLSAIAAGRSRSKLGPDGFTHGSQTGWMVKRCSCTLCFTAKREWHRARNAARRKPDGRGPYAERF